jgi:hypothetical protein
MHEVKLREATPNEERKGRGLVGVTVVGSRGAVKNLLPATKKWRRKGATLL